MTFVFNLFTLQIPITMTSTTTKLLFLTFAVMYMMVMATAQRTPKPLAEKPETLSPPFSFNPVSQCAIFNQNLVLDQNLVYSWNRPFLQCTVFTQLSAAPE
jgi:hypothetical protein